MNWKTLQRHPFNVVPNANEKDLEELRISILQGYDHRYPIWVFQGPDDAEPMVIDGMQRLGICYDLDETPLVREFNGTEQEAVEFIMRSIRRRDLTAGQKAATILDLSELVGRLEKEARSKQGQRTDLHDDEPLDTNVQRLNTNINLGDLAGVGQQTIKQMKSIQKYSPELYGAVKAGSISASSASRQVKEKQADSTQAAKMKAKNIIQKAINEAIRRDAPGYMAQVTKEVLENGTSNIKFKITLDD